MRQSLASRGRTHARDSDRTDYLDERDLPKAKNGEKKKKKKKRLWEGRHLVFLSILFFLGGVFFVG